MTALGFRCSNTDYAYCILSGTRTAPIVRNAKRVSFPNGYSEPELLNWLHLEVAAILDREQCNVVGIKRAEVNVKRSNALEARIQGEAIVSLAAAQSGCLDVHRKVSPTIAKDFGLKGKAKYLESDLDTTLVPQFGTYPPKIQEAILVAWSCM